MVKKIRVTINLICAGGCVFAGFLPAIFHVTVWWIVPLSALSCLICLGAAAYEYFKK